MAPGELPITASSSDLLHVVLDALRHVVVDDTLYVTLVNTHAECDGADQALYLIVDEVSLDHLALLIGLTSMVALRVNPVLSQHTC